MRQTVLAVEPLEPRWVPAIDISATFTFQGYGDAGDDKIRSDAAETSQLYGDTASPGDTEAAGDDTIYGGGKKNIIFGGGGNDSIDGRGDANTDNQLHGNAGHDFIRLGAGWGQLFGDDGPDELIGTGGNQAKSLQLFGGAGDDYLATDNRGATLDGGAGHGIYRKPGKQLAVGDDNAATDWHPTVGAASASSNVILKGQKVTLRAENVTDTQGPNPGIQKVVFYYDVDGDGKWDPNIDNKSVNAVNVNGRWEYETLPMNEVRRYTYFAVAFDNYGDFSKAEKFVLDVQPPGVGFMGFDHFNHVVNYQVTIPDFDVPTVAHYTIAPGTAALGLHFDLIDPTATGVDAGTITFAAHQTTATIQLQIRDFANGEAGAPGDRDFAVVLADEYGDQLFSGEGVIRSFTYYLRFSGDQDVTEPTYDEDDPAATAYVYLSAAPFEGVSIKVRSQEQSARNTKDIEEFDTLLSFGAGEVRQPFGLGIVDDDMYERLPEHFEVSLSNAKAGIIEPDSETSIVKIRDDDPIPTLYVNDVEVTVGDPALFYAFLSNPSQEAITVYYYTYDGSAADGTDYTGAFGTWEFAAEQTMITEPVSVATTPDYQEGTKKFYLTFESADYVQLPLIDAVGTIMDGQEWVEGQSAGHFEWRDLGAWIRREVGQRWVNDYYVPGHMEGGEWIEGMFTGGQWIEGHLEGGELVPGHYEGGVFISGRYVDGDWVEGHYDEDGWVAGHFEGGSFEAGHYEGGVFIPGHSESHWVDTTYDELGNVLVEGHEESVWIDATHVGGTWIDDRWIGQTWVDGYFAIRNWIAGFFEQVWQDEHWENREWVDDQWVNQQWVEGHYEGQVWVDAHWENQTWVEGQWVGHYETDYADEWAADWQSVWVDESTPGHFRVT